MSISLRFHRLAENAFEKVELAGVYLDDGAPREAARLLRQAADKLDELASERDALLRQLAR